MPGPQPAPPAVVLDTNAVLDWLVFRNPELESLGAAIVRGDVRWIATAWMRAELAHVLDRGHLDAWQPELPGIWAQWERHCAQQPTPTFTGPSGRLRCSDPDDQPFIDLARAGGARWLISRDRAVLKLARRLREHGVAVIPPGAWRPLDPTA
ncbi:MAG TPA: PIN domain-containing protein [Burkholderiaceae bacterium]|nr:PIN domain-containing protein [Burkholderiaceae bacterium]